MPIPSPDEVLGGAGSSLNEQQIAFAHRYAIDGNGTASYIEVYGAANDSSAAASAYKLVHDPRVAELVTTLRKGILDKYDVTADRIIREYARIAFLDIADLHDEKGAILPVKEMPEDARRAIAGLEVQELTIGESSIGVLKKVKLSDKRAALFDLAKIKKMVTDKTEHSLDESFTALIAQAFGAP